jgi:hypothetical protein
MSPLTISRPLARSPKDQPMHPTITTATNGAGSAGGPRRHALARCALTVVAASAAAAAATLSLAVAPVLADDCPNAALRTQNNSTQLPGCRAYERVSPEFKEGFTAAPIGFTDEGRLAYLSNGNYANNGNGYAGLPGGNGYLASRARSSWVTKGIAPAGPDFVTTSPEYPYQGRAYAAALSSDLRSSLFQMRRTDQPEGTVSDLYVRRPDDVFARVGSALDPLNPLSPRSAATLFIASDDLSHVVFSADSGGTYEYVGIDGGPPRLVSVDNSGQPLTSVPECTKTTTGGYHSMSADGRVIFFGCINGAVYARVSGTTTIAVSGTQCSREPSDPGGACGAGSAAGFVGANADGTRVYFTTSQQLVNGDTDNTSDLYECDVAAGTPAAVGSVNQCPDLREVSGAATGADVQPGTRISDDGSRAYFVATGVLASNLDANNSPATAGNDNLYVWTRDTAHPDGETRFVARLDPADASKDGMRQTTDDGHYLVFGTYTPLIDHGPQADTDTGRDIYRYDAETGALTRLSTGDDGEGGNEPGADANFIPIGYGPTLPNRPAPRGAMTDDGGSVVFTTDETLASNDTNGTVDVYLWHGGRVSLISSGKPSEDHNFTLGTTDPFGSGAVTIEAFISPSGRDVFFTTTAPLIPNDVDTVMDIYAARVDGGFDQSTSPQCSGDACQSPPSPPPPASKPGSTSSPGQHGLPQITPAFTVGKLTASQLNRVASTGKVSLKVATNAPGTLSAKATAMIAKRPSTAGSAKRTVVKAGTVSLSLTLSKKARTELKSTRKLTVKVLVRQDNVAIARTVSLKLTQPKTAKRKSARKTSRHADKGGRS